MQDDTTIVISENSLEIVEDVEQTAETTTELRFSDVVNKPFNEMTSTEFNAFHFEVAISSFALILSIFSIAFSKGVFK